MNHRSAQQAQGKAREEAGTLLPKSQPQIQVVPCHPAPPPAVGSLMFVFNP